MMSSGVKTGIAASIGIGQQMKARNAVAAPGSAGGDAHMLETEIQQFQPRVSLESR